MPSIMDARQSRPRVIKEFDLPEEMQDQDQYVKKSIGLTSLTVDQEMEASKATGGAYAVAFAFARMALVEVDGRPVNKAEAEDETILRNCDQTIRGLIFDAYAEVAIASEKSRKSFLASAKTKIG